MLSLSAEEHQQDKPREAAAGFHQHSSSPVPQQPPRYRGTAPTATGSPKERDRQQVPPGGQPPPGATRCSSRGQLTSGAPRRTAPLGGCGSGRCLINSTNTATTSVAVWTKPTPEAHAGGGSSLLKHGDEATSSWLEGCLVPQQAQPHARGFSSQQGCFRGYLAGAKRATGKPLVARR